MSFSNLIIAKMEQNNNSKDNTPIDFTDSFLPSEEQELIKVKKNKHRWYGQRFHLTIHGQHSVDLQRLIKFFQATDVKAAVDSKSCVIERFFFDDDELEDGWHESDMRFAGFKVRLAVIAKEFGRHKIHPHWQVYFELTARVSMKSFMKSILGHDNFHLEKAKSTSAASIAYVYGVGKEYEGGFVVFNLHAPLPLRYNASVADFWLNFQFRPFQKTLAALVDLPPHKRTIYYIYEPHGNVGKTLFIEYLHIFHGAIVTGGNSHDMKYAIERWRQITGAFPIFICVDIARSENLTKESYEALESIKNGLFFSGKYESTMTHAFVKPHVLIFSNKPPVLSAFSKDRWVVYTINDTYELVDADGNLVESLTV